MARAQANRLLALALCSLWPCVAAGETVTTHPLTDALGPLPVAVDHVALADELAARPLPPLSAFQASIRPAESLAILRRTYLDTLALLPAYDDRRGNIRAIVVSGGIANLDALAASLNAPDVLVCDPAACLLRAALYIEAGAGLIIKDRTLLLETETGAFIAVSGELVTHGATVEGVRGGKPALMDYSDGAVVHDELDPRPFIVTYDGSRVHLVKSRFAYLGFDAPSAYGLTMTTGNLDRAEGEPPTGAIVYSEFEELYYGLYTHRAAGVQVVGNDFTGSIEYGIDPHDYSTGLVIAGNRVSYTRNLHGIVLSRGVTNSIISGNVSVLNGGSGIVLDRHSNNNHIIGNTMMNNDGDGIAIYESNNVAIIGNTSHSNYWGDIRIRNSVGTVVANNALGASDFGVLLEAGKAGGRARRDEDIYERRIDVSLSGNSMSQHREAGLIIRCVARLRLYAINEHAWPGLANEADAALEFLTPEPKHDLAYALSRRDEMRDPSTIFITGRPDWVNAYKTLPRGQSALLAYDGDC